MVIGQQSRRPNTYKVSTHSLAKVPAFSCLGILFDEKLKFKHLLEEKLLEMTRSMGAIANYAHRLGTGSPGTILKLYNSFCISKALYGSEVWGYMAANKLQTAENKYFRRIVNVPQSTPL